MNKKLYILSGLFLLLSGSALAATYEQLYAELSRSPGLDTQILPLGSFTIDEMIDKAVQAEKNHEMFGITQTRPSSPGITFYLVSVSVNFDLAQPELAMTIGPSSQVLSQYAGGELLDFSFQSSRVGKYTKDFNCAQTHDKGTVIRICGEGNFDRFKFKPSTSTLE